MNVNTTTTESRVMYAAATGATPGPIRRDRQSQEHTPWNGSIRALLLLVFATLPAFAAFPNGYSFCKVVTTKYEMVPGSSDLANYPLTVMFTDPDLRSTANGGLVNHINGYDIGFYPNCSGSGTALKWEIESYSPTTGAIVAHVLRPNLSHTADDTIGMHYGGSHSSFQSVAGQVWSSSYKGVWHLANGSLGADSTTNATNSVSLNSTTGITGLIAGAASFNGSSNYIDYGNAAGLNVGLSDITVSAWFKTSAAGFAPLISKSRSADETGGRYCLYVNAGQVSFLVTGSPIAGSYVKTVSSTGSTYNDGNWHYAVATVSRIGNIILYIDGAISGTPINFGSYSGVNLPNADKFYLGQYPDATGQAPAPTNYYAGTLDEARVSIGTAHSAEWILTEYRNQMSPATYITAGPRITTPGSNSFRHSVRDGL